MEYVNKLLKGVILIAVLVFAYFFVKGVLDKAGSPITLAGPSFKSASQKQPALSSVVQSSLAGSQGTYSVAVNNLKTGQRYYLDEHRIYEAASLYKLWVMAVVYQQIEAGNLDEDQILSEDIDKLNDKFNIDPDLAEQTEGTITLSVHDALNQMITISHNYAALLLTEKVRLSSLAKFLKDNGFNDSEVGTNGESPTTSAYDIAYFLEKLYSGRLASPKYTAEMIGLLKNQQLNDGIPKYLPDPAKVANKTGDLEQFKHDTAIVYTDKEDYILVILSESNFPSAAQERIAGLSKAVYDYFQKTD